MIMAIKNDIFQEFLEEYISANRARKSEVNYPEASLPLTTLRFVSTGYSGMLRIQHIMRNQGFSYSSLNVPRRKRRGKNEQTLSM
jgi:hypothetical protein